MSEIVTKPLIGITVGDPVGIGPEVVAKTLVEPEIYTYCLNEPLRTDSRRGRKFVRNGYTRNKKLLYLLLYMCS